MPLVRGSSALPSVLLYQVVENSYVTVALLPTLLILGDNMIPQFFADRVSTISGPDAGLGQDGRNSMFYARVA